MTTSLTSLPPLTSFDVVKDAAKIADLTATHESLARFPSFSDETAWTIGTTIRETFLEQYLEKYGGPEKTGVVIHIELFTGHVLFSAAVGKPPIVGPDNWNWVKGKMNVVRRFNVSSLRKGRQIEAAGSTPEAKGLNLPEFACHGGGFPIWLKNNNTCPIGVIVVSGLPQLADHQLIIDSLAKVLA